MPRIQSNTPMLLFYAAMNVMFGSDHIKQPFDSIFTIDMAHGRASKTILPANRFLFFMSSQVLNKMICRPFSESMAPRLEIEDVDGGIYSDVLDLWCGKIDLQDESLNAVMAMTSVADRLEMTEVGLAPP
jgi:hypothetical protein